MIDIPQAPSEPTHVQSVPFYDILPRYYNFGSTNKYKDKKCPLLAVTVQWYTFSIII